MAAAQDQAAMRDDAVEPLAAAEARRLLDAVEGRFRRAAKNGKDSLVAPQIDGVVAPFACSHLAAIDGKNGGEFLAVKGDGRDGREKVSLLKSIGCGIGLAQPERYGFRVTHQIGP